MNAIVTFPNFEKYGGVRRARMTKAGVGIDFPKQGITYPSSLALMWRDTSNAKPLRYITFNGKYLVVKNV